MPAAESYADVVTEQAYGEALLCIAQGETREITRNALLDIHPVLTQDWVADILADALRDALKQGVEREDIDPSWF